jgi:prepilin-type N-terminal cleavage/methylation domain-containing protein
MVHGSNMTRGHKKMRSGISLVEMLIAIVLFGVISVIGYKYYKNYYNTTLAAKQARIAAVIDQATQISNAYDLYTAKVGVAPTLMTDLSAAGVKILTKKPDAIPEITATGWAISTTAALNDATLNDIVFTYPVDGAAATNADKLEYCNILNNFTQSAWPLDEVDTDVGTSLTMYDATNANTLAFTSMMCYRTALNTYTIAFVKSVTP